MALGSTSLDFGAVTPGRGDATATVTGQGAILVDSKVEAMIRVADSADHSADEHGVETISIACGNIVAGVGFTVYAQIREGFASGVFNIDWVWT